MLTSGEGEELKFESAPIVLPNTSRRNPMLSDINIWTSENVVARIHNPKGFVEGLRAGRDDNLSFLSTWFSLQYDSIKEKRGVEWRHRV